MPGLFFSTATSRQFLTFAGIGTIGTAGHYLTLFVLVQVLLLDPVVATTVGFIVGALINYHLNYKITFKSNKSHHEAIVKFFTIAILGGVLNSYLMYLGLNVTTLNYFIIQLIATSMVLVLNFTFNKIWTFAE